ncbi:hypothetical protein [Jannaschia rubra]|uniref:Uncharacterized protein n=1 Tax=Jannaschia rubra TaxID=282197 RepID=A0A0M6XJM5_9RHOB|nr:hypothetical protein [Jannaschia rubra]CTQ31400.1 hypothetical protein JAN5088_00156 [Jannaschia rubra]SFF80284.1 hypothetical protein SAMN04488517_101261 [Jannaschia rubra]
MLGSTPLRMAVAFVLMWGWAVLATRIHPMPAPMIAVPTQGALSAALTAGLKRGVEALSRHIGGSLLPALAALAASATLLVAAHLVAGTPESAATVAMPLAVSGSYVLLFSYLNDRRRA